MQKQREILKDLMANLKPRMEALEYKINKLGQTDWFQGIDDEVLSIKWLVMQIERVSKGNPLKKKW